MANKRPYVSSMSRATEYFRDSPCPMRRFLPVIHRIGFHDLADEQQLCIGEDNDRSMHHINAFCLFRHGVMTKSWNALESAMNERILVIRTNIRYFFLYKLRATSSRKIPIDYLHRFVSIKIH